MDCISHSVIAGKYKLLVRQIQCTIGIGTLNKTNVSMGGAKGRCV